LVGSFGLLASYLVSTCGPLFHFFDPDQIHPSAAPKNGRRGRWHVFSAP
jgi:hypothetical protein